MALEMNDGKYLLNTLQMIDQMSSRPLEVFFAVRSIQLMYHLNRRMH